MIWPFRDKKPSRREIRAAFGPYLSKQTLDALADPRGLKLAPAERASIPYVIFQVRDNALGDVQRHLSRAVTIAIEHDGLVMNMMSSTVMIVMSKLVADRQEALAKALVAALGTNVRVIYGRSEGLWGNVGVDQRLHYGAILPNFNTTLGLLGRQDFGIAMRVG